MTRRPTADAMLMALLVLNRERDELAERRRDLVHPADTVNAQKKAEQLDSVHAWITAERAKACASEARRCSAGRTHRVREVVRRYDDGITVQRCRCGAERVHDEHTRDFSDWHKST